MDTMNPMWLDAESIGFCERLELLTYRFLTYIPVIISFSVFGFILSFYIFVSNCHWSTDNSSDTLTPLLDTFIPVLTSTIISIVTNDICIPLQCFIHPVFIGDFAGTIGVKDYWLLDAEKESDQYYASIYIGIFVFCVFQLFLAMSLTICTDPG
jgi:hypothetical protein